MADNLPTPASDDGGEFLLYQTNDGTTRIEVRMAADTVWLTQKDMADLFQTTPQNITQHLASIYEEGELAESATCKEYLQVRSEGNRQVERSLKHYNLDVIISIGYRVRSHRGTQFRIWATQRLREYLIKGFAMDDQRLKQCGSSIREKPVRFHTCADTFQTSYNKPSLRTPHFERLMPNIKALRTLIGLSFEESIARQRSRA